MTTPFIATPEERIRFQAFMDLANSIEEIVWTAEPNGQADYFNRHWFRYTGMTIEQSQGAGWTAAVHTEDLQHCVEIWTNALTNLRPLEVNFRLRRTDGMYQHHICRTNPVFDAQGKIYKWFGMTVNVHAARMRNEEIKKRHQHEVELLKAENRALLAKLAKAREQQSTKIVPSPNP